MFSATALLVVLVSLQSCITQNLQQEGFYNWFNTVFKTDSTSQECFDVPELSLGETDSLRLKFVLEDGRHIAYNPYMQRFELNEYVTYEGEVDAGSLHFTSLVKGCKTMLMDIFNYYYDSRECCHWRGHLFQLVPGKTKNEATFEGLFYQSCHEQENCIPKPDCGKCESSILHPGTDIDQAYYISFFQVLTKPGKYDGRFEIIDYLGGNPPYPAVYPVNVRPKGFSQKVYIELWKIEKQFHYK